MEGFRKKGIYLPLVIAIFIAFLGLLYLSSAQAQESQPILHLQLLIVGPKLTVKQETLTLPRNIPTILNTEIALPTEEIDKAAFMAQYLADAIVEAELRGPAYTTPIPLTCEPNGNLSIPAIPMAGKYLLENIRLTRDGETLFMAEPRVVPIEVIDEILITKVTSRPLTLQEIREKGIVLSPDSFEAYEFTAVFALQAGKKIEIKLPVIRPSSRVGEYYRFDEEARTPMLPELQLRLGGASLDGDANPPAYEFDFEFEGVKSPSPDFRIPPVPCQNFI